jgi:hypothetical protein
VKKKRGDHEFTPERRSGRIVANLFILFVLVVFLYDIFMQTEHWPFSSHRMYSTLVGPNYVKVQLFMITPDGEVPLDTRVQLAPFDTSRLTYMLRSLASSQNRRAAEEVLANLAEIYEKNKALHGEKWPKMLGLAAYRLQWRLDPELKNLDYPQKDLLFSFRFP